ncbi:Long-chain base-1-phosphate phosphatase [Marasmius crinis-equi]|uniref:Long-chain base-1-phosphate phosphatase n=1 Tax=Marasmius crinis-equi TaxID=585013 RepID=A0ABR3FWM6_9AGAR
MQNGQSNGRVTFDLEDDFSEPPTRSPSPSPWSENQGFFDEKARGHSGIDVSPGKAPSDIYEATLPWWRAAIRRKIVQRVEVESKVVARLQNAIRCSWLDSYFVYTSSLGTHTFFMVMLPVMFFFGYPEMGLGLISVLVSGVYFSSFLKDLFCAPRPYSPPVTRLTIGTHHLEYGFPSSHSTNSVSMALFFYSHVHMLATPTSDAPASISNSTYILLVIILLWYTVSIVFGRLYTAMHSFTDCAMGVFLGAFLWWCLADFPGFFIQIPTTVYTILNPFSWWFSSTLDDPYTTIRLFKGLGYFTTLKSWVDTSGWEVPMIIVPLTLLLVNQHPQPVDDCPCFEDAIAFNSVFASALLLRWSRAFFRTDYYIEPRPMPGSGWVEVFDLPGVRWMQIDRGLSHILQWWWTAALKMVVGIAIIFAWRIVAKSLLHIILPPTFRFLSHLFTLPKRRFYTPATDYKNVPSEFHFDPDHPGAGLSGLRPIPSVIDLPSSVKVGVESDDGVGSGMDVGGMGSDLKMRGRNGNGMAVNGNGMNGGKTQGTEAGQGKPDGVKHYDAEVLTKVVVYAGIGALATGFIPMGFELLGWGVSSTPPGF